MKLGILVLLCWTCVTRMCSGGDVTASTNLALGLFQQLSADPSENVLFSPFGISVLLAILSAGTKGGTGKEIESVFGSDAAAVKRDIESAFNEVCAGASTAGRKSPMSLGNLLVVKKGLKSKLLPLFLKFLGDGGPFLTLVDELDDNLASRSNKWVSTQTNGEITKMLDGHGTEDDAKMLLVNAIHFKGDWKEKFEKQLGYNGTFKNYDGSDTPITFMFKRRHFEYALDATLKTHVISIPYRDVKARFILLVPLKHAGARTLANLLTASEWKRILGTLRNTSVALSMPKFDVSKKYDLMKPLEYLGIKTIFTDKADLSGMIGTGDLFVSAIEQVSKLRVDEEGSEADSATLLRISGKAAEEGESVIADHPFIFAVTAGRQDDILFMGQVNKLPTT
ncbi:hypothetical protein HPB49_025518 [Dermacentor silvarum]|uniref:Uncharacterized protein n=1 Tax=Dermacentor silvarum TaxID=543639 RepID=A0ACB8D1H6_DERSI|nr:leukocyte elastase inhibitor [Dermacentor silvarum]XP_049521542.1 leukocyte elastase inhibitor [Dermacentor silvarum]KAH7955207.1 hypothetical protein HPB49_025518 [Dermacentor silvarum]